jgi:hypothetical protein
MAEASHIILLAGEASVPQEQVTNAAIVPGMLVEFIPTAGANQGKFRAHSTAGGNAAPAFALENQTPTSRSNVPQIDQAYEVGDMMRWCLPRKGALLYAFATANAAAIVKGDYLESAGDGALRLHGVPVLNQTAGIVAIAAENLDNSANAARARLRVWTM